MKGEFSVSERGSVVSSFALHWNWPISSQLPSTSPLIILLDSPSKVFVAPQSLYYKTFGSTSEPPAVPPLWRNFRSLIDSSLPHSQWENLGKTKSQRQLKVRELFHTFREHRRKQGATTLKLYQQLLHSQTNNSCQHLNGNFYGLLMAKRARLFHPF